MCSYIINDAFVLLSILTKQKITLTFNKIITMFNSYSIHTILRLEKSMKISAWA